MWFQSRLLELASLSVANSDSSHLSLQNNGEIVTFLKRTLSALGFDEVSPALA
jgi:hypothetical protein